MNSKSTAFRPRKRVLIWGTAAVIGATSALVPSAYTQNTATVSRASAKISSTQPAFDQNVGVFVKQNCAVCHNDQLKTAGLTLTQYHDTASMLKDRVIWERVVARIRSGEMPPKGMPRPKPEAIATTTGWIDAQFAEFDRTAKPDPGRLTAHRLNRTEYNNTVRDLLAVKFNPANNFPADDSGYGFDNIGDVLSVSPLLMDKYLAAASKIASQAIPNGSLPKPTQVKFSPDHPINEERLELENTFDMPAEADYDLRAVVSGRKDPFQISVLLDGREIISSPVIVDKEKPRNYELHLHLPYGEHVVRAAITPRDATPEEVEIAAALKAADQAAMAKQIARHPEDRKEIEKQHTISNPPTYVDAIEIRGPFNPLPPPPPPSYSRIFVCGHAPGHHTAECARTNLAHLARLAYRRPVTDAEVKKLTNLVAMAQREGLDFDGAMKIGVQAVLVSPNFLFRIEHDVNPNDATAVHSVNDYELASRLSYFLWSSAPDEALLKAAEAHNLGQREVLHAQVRRMLLDKKAEALIDNFAGQWLELRNLDSVHPDPDQFPQFDKDLRNAMYTETRMFVAAMVHEDKSILDLLNGKYSYMNERLANFYGIPGVTGKQFRLVSLDGTQRSGILTQASVLTVTSYPTRTSPVLRGKWILENVLNTPPPPPPPGVGSIENKNGVVSGTMRQIMEQHRANPMCAQCHKRMDPLGFSLENYNAIGQWRTQDNGQPVDSSGVLPDGQAFKGSAEMKAILMTSRDSFAECLTEKMMIYALGRGLEGFDRPATKKIVARLAKNNYRFSSLIDGIVDSMPFQMGRGDAGGSVTE